MKIKSAPRASLTAVVAAFATFAASGALAQVNDGTLWLKCDETGRGGGSWFKVPLGYMAVSSNSIVVYTSDEIRRWTDLCGYEGARCTVNSDEIRAVFKVPNDPDYIYTVTISRSSGMYRQDDEPARFNNSHGVRVLSGWLEGQCRRTTDPRPPAAF